MASASDEKPLQGWDEIAHFLNISKRTAQSYRRTHKLPVRQLDGDKSPVWAYASELEEWRRNSAPVEAAPDTPPPPPADGGGSPVLPAKPAAVRVTLRSLLSAAAALAVVALLAWAAWPHPSVADLRRDDRDIVAVSAGGSEIWRYRLPQSMRESHYVGLHRTLVKFFLLADITEDGTPEVLFHYIPIERDTLGSTLFCFDQRGKVLWTFTPGREVKDQEQRYLPPFIIADFLALPASSKSRLVVNSYHSVHFPSQIAFLNARGELESEYWHSGHLNHMRMSDLDSDGAPEILLGGVNNGIHAATLVVLEPGTNGCSGQPPGDPSQLQACLHENVEKAVVIFPRTRYNLALHPYNRIMSLDVKPTVIDVTTSETVYQQGEYMSYELDRNLNLLSARPSDSLLSLIKSSVATGKLKTPFTDEEARSLRNLTVRRRQLGAR